MSELSEKRKIDYSLWREKVREKAEKALSDEILLNLEDHSSYDFKHEEIIKNINNRFLIFSIILSTSVIVLAIAIFIHLIKYH